MSEGVAFIRDLMVILLAATAGGWGARRLGLPVVVGYLLAGLVIGAPQITVVYLIDPDRIQILSQVGLVLLMFSIGTGIRIRQLKALGLGPVVATVIASLLMLSLGRLGAGLMGLDRTTGLFFASMLVVSSSAIIGKVVQERQLLHKKFGQYALSQTLLEDFVAVILLGVLGSVTAYGAMDETAGAGLIVSLAKLGGFVLLILLTGLVLLPRVISLAQREGGEELQILLAGGLLFTFALMAVLAGYSLALGAFLFGMLIAESTQMQFFSRSFSGMRDIFTALFFVSIGMGIDLSMLPESMDLIIWGTLIALVGRTLCATAGWMAACEKAPDAVRTALHVTPIGEFSFIIAGFGIAAGILPPRFQIAAVGISLLTSLIAPLTMGQAERIIHLLRLDVKRPPPPFLEAYRGFWARLLEGGRRHLLWKFLRKRFIQTGRELAWAVAVMIFSRPVYLELEGFLVDSGTRWTAIVLPWFWVGIMILLLIPIVSIVRNIQAIAMILAEYYTRQRPDSIRLSRSMVLLFQTVGILLLVLVLANAGPWWLFDKWSLAGLIGITLLTMFLGWNRFIRLHSEAEGIFQDILDVTLQEPRQQWESTGQTWGLTLGECIIPGNALVAGKTIGSIALREKCGATIIGMERQGMQVGQPTKATPLYPEDRIYLIGDNEQVEKATSFLSQPRSRAQAPSPTLSQAILKSVPVPDACPLAGKILSELNWPSLYGVHVVAVRAGGKDPILPKADWKLSEGHELLLAGEPLGLDLVKALMEGIHEAEKV